MLSPGASALPQQVRIVMYVPDGGRPREDVMPKFYFHLSNCD